MPIKTQSDYIAMLEELVLAEGEYVRCEYCKRIYPEGEIDRHDLDGAQYMLCDNCLPRFIDESREWDSYLKSREEAYKNR